MKRICSLTVAIVMLVIIGCAGNAPVIPINNIGNVGQKQASEDLLKAAKKGAVKEIEFALFRGAEINVVDRKGNTPLILTAKEGHLSAVKKLVDKGVNPDYRDLNNKTALSHAQEAGHKDVVGYLLSFQLSKRERRLLLEDFQENVLNTLAEKVRLGLLLEADPNSENTHGWTVLMSAVLKRRIDITEMLLNAGADPNAKDENGWTALMIAAETGHVGTTGLLIESGAELETKRKHREDYWKKGRVTALFYALEHPKVLKYLIGKGAKFSYHFDDDALLVHTVESENPESTMVILDSIKEYRVYSYDDMQDDMNTALRMSAARGYIKLCKKLLEKGSFLNGQNNDGWTAVMLASANDQAETVRFLKKEGAGLHDRVNNSYDERDEMTALEIAETKGFSEIVKILEEPKSSKKVMQ